MYQGKYLAAAPAVKKKKRITAGTIIFYILYFLLIAAFAVGMHYALSALNDWLVTYEASQPDNKSEQIFQQLFADPDWAEIYTMSAQEDTLFETKESYAAYMEQKVGGAELTYSKTSAGLSGGQKYIVKLGEEKLATFTLTNSVESELEIPQWELDTIEVFFTRNESVTIQTQFGRTITVNGIPLDDSYIIQATSTVAEDYLPEGVGGKRSSTFYVDGLLYAPEIVVTDINGNTVQMTYDAQTCTYSEVLPDNGEIPDEEYNTVLNAIQAYCRYMIGIKSAPISSYFDTSSDIYKSITRNELWFKGYSSYNFSDAQVSDYVLYCEDLFSARVSITLNVIRGNGSVKKFEVDNTLFLTKNGNGKWKITEMTNVDVQKVLTQVRLTYIQDNDVIRTEMVPTDITQLQLPQVTVPEGKVFAGWFRETADESGTTTYSLVFAPDESGTATLPSGYELEPMVLHALFENKGA